MTTSEPEADVWTVVLKVKLDMDTSREHRRAILDEYVAPEIAELSGFLLASWMNDGNGTGLCLVEFDNEEHAREAVGSLTAHGGPEVLEWGVYAVEFEASG